MKARVYRVKYERDEAGWWVAEAIGVAAQSQGRTLEQARTRIREAIAALRDVSLRSVTIQDEIGLSTAGRRAVSLAKKAVVKAAEESERADRATQAAAEALLHDGLSLRDAGALLGVSRQRVHQILARGRKATG